MGFYDHRCEGPTCRCNPFLKPDQVMKPPFDAISFIRLPDHVKVTNVKEILHANGWRFAKGYGFVCAKCINYLTKEEDK